MADGTPVAPVIKFSFKSKVACPGESRYLSVESVTGYYSYQWQRDGIDIQGATSNNYTAQTTGSYTVRLIRGGTCSATSLPLSLTFSNAIQPVVNLNWSLGPTGETCSGANPYVNEASSLSGYQYQWYLNGQPIPFINASGFGAGSSGLYSVRVTNGSCTGLSKEVYISVNNGKTSKSVVSVSPNSGQLCTANSSLLTAVLSVGSLQWKRNGVDIPDATQRTYYATQSGLYTIVNREGTCSAESDPIELKIGETTTATLSGNVLITAGKSALLPVSFTGPAPWSASLTSGQSVTATYQNPAFIAVSPTSNTTYQLASVVNACGTGTVSGQASVSVGTGSADVSLNMAVSNRATNVGDAVTYILTAYNEGPDQANGIQLQSILPAGLNFVSSTSPEISAANGVVSASLGSIPTNGQSTVTFLATPAQPGVFATTAQITATSTPDPDSQPNSGTGDGQDDAATADIRTTSNGPLVASANPNQVPLPKVLGNQPVTDASTADLSLAMQVSKLTPVQNELVTTSLTVSNRGGSAAASIAVQVQLPNGTVNGQSPAGWVLVSGQTYRRYINSLPAGQSVILTLLWQPAGSGTLKAQIFDASVADSDSTPGNGYDNGEDDEVSLSVRLR